MIESQYGQNVTRYIGIAVFSLFLLIMPYFRGLFFEQDIYIFEFGLILLFSVMIILMYRTKSVETFRAVIIYPLLLLVAIYYLSSLQGFTPQLAFDEFLRWFMYAIVFIGLIIIANKKNNTWILNAIFLSIIWVSAFGLFAHFGRVDFADAILGVNPGRISSVLQYPNTLASIIGAAIVGILLYTIREDIKWYIRGLYLTQLVPLFTVFVYTQSRTVYLLLPIIWFIGLFFLNFSQQLRYILITLMMGIFSLYPVLRYEQYLANHNDTIIFFIFALGILCSLVYISVTLLMNRVPKKESPKSRIIRLIIPAVLLFLMLIFITLIITTPLINFLPESIKIRVESIGLQDSSVTGRFTFFKDSFEMFKDHWFIGAGGNAWKGLYLSYESLPYTSTQTHSFVMKVLTDVGILGTVALLAFLGVLFLTIYRWIKVHGFHHEGLVKIGVPLVMSLMLFLHSLFDFNMSYGYISILWITLLALIYVEVREERTELSITKVSLSKVLVWLTTFISLFLLIVIGKYAYAETIKIDGIHYSNALKNIEKRIALSPSNIDYRFQKIDALELAYKDSNDQAYVQELLQEALKIEELDKNNPISLIKTAQYFAKYGYGKNAIESSSRAIEKAPWLLVAYEQYISYGTQYSIALLREDKVQETTELLKDVQSWLNTFEKNLSYRDKMIPEKYRYQYPYDYSDVIRQYGGSALIMIGDYDRAKTYLEPLLNNVDTKKKLDATLWLSILEEKIGNNELAAQLVNQGNELDPEFEQKRTEILQLMQKLPIQK